MQRIPDGLRNVVSRSAGHRIPSIAGQQPATSSRFEIGADPPPSAGHLLPWPARGFGPLAAPVRNVGSRPAVLSPGRGILRYLWRADSGNIPGFSGPFRFRPVSWTNCNLLFSSQLCSVKISCQSPESSGFPIDISFANVLIFPWILSVAPDSFRCSTGRSAVDRENFPRQVRPGEGCPAALMSSDRNRSRGRSVSKAVFGETVFDCLKLIQARGFNGVGCQPYAQDAPVGRIRPAERAGAAARAAEADSLKKSIGRVIPAPFRVRYQSSGRAAVYSKGVSGR